VWGERVDLLGGSLFGTLEFDRKVHCYVSEVCKLLSEHTKCILYVGNICVVRRVGC
jgi:hypothetical protein